MSNWHKFSDCNLDNIYWTPIFLYASGLRLWQNKCTSNLLMQRANIRSLLILNYVDTIYITKTKCVSVCLWVTANNVVIFSSIWIHEGWHIWRKDFPNSRPVLVKNFSYKCVPFHVFKFSFLFNVVWGPPRNLPWQTNTRSVLFI